jgi:hypothetical protein
MIMASILWSSAELKTELETSLRGSTPVAAPDDAWQRRAGTGECASGGLMSHSHTRVNLGQVAFVASACADACEP